VHGELTVTIRELCRDVTSLSRCVLLLAVSMQNKRKELSVSARHQRISRVDSGDEPGSSGSLYREQSGSLDEEMLPGGGDILHCNR
jgi:hypothetical protein